MEERLAKVRELKGKYSMEKKDVVFMEILAEMNEADAKTDDHDDSISSIAIKYNVDVKDARSMHELSYYGITTWGL